MSGSLQFKLEKISKSFREHLSELINFLSDSPTDELKIIKDKLEAELDSALGKSFFSVALIGQYSAGKSTIISALTGRSDIFIDSDVATSETRFYDWNGIKLIDTPGLWADHDDHDSITYKAIEQADLLVFCLTHSLFDKTTVNNFKKLAYDKGYANKIMLVVNKMSKESGAEEDKIANYLETLRTSLHPHDVEEFPLCFIDAQDYREGKEEQDNLLIEASRFQTFIDTLNNFVHDKADVARFDPPVRITIGWVEKAKTSSIRKSPNDRAFLQVLYEVERMVENQRSRLRVDSDALVTKATRDLIGIGDDLVSSISAENKHWEEKTKSEIGERIKEVYEYLEVELLKVFMTSVQQLENGIKDLRNGDLVQELLRVEQAPQAVSIGKPSNAGIQISNLLQALEKRPGVLFAGAFLSEVVEYSAINKETWSQLKEANQALNQAFLALMQHPVGPEHAAAVETLRQAQQHYSNVNPFHWDLFLSREGAEGSILETFVSNVGNLGSDLGLHLDFLDSVTMTQILGDIGHCLSPALTLLAVHSQFQKMEREKQKENQMAEMRVSTRRKFRAMSNDLKKKAAKKRSKLEHDIHDSLVQQINQLRLKREREVAESEGLFVRLREFREVFENIRVSLDSLLSSSELSTR